ncbi:MAG TPA: M48 family metallopeptidase [Myxococcaceae bacterium]|jgi:STE24 endopeptidase
MRLHLFHAHLAAAALALLPAAARAADEADGTPTPPVKLVYREIPQEAQETPLDVNKATRAYLNLVSGPAREKSDAYFEGGYWLQLWSFLLSLAVALLLLQGRISTRMRVMAERITSMRWLQPAVYWVQYFVAVGVLTFPFDVYVGYFREHQYDLSNLTFGGWLGEQAKGMAIGLLLGAVGLTALYAVLRKVKQNWWIWAAGVALAFSVLTVVIGPVFLEPLFNQFRPVQDVQVREAVLRLARANGIPATDVFEYDASKQSDRVSAHVSGFLGTTRISLNDNLLKRCNLAQIESVMAHEMGHYVLNHVLKTMIFFAVFFPLALAFAQWAVAKLLASRGERWGVRGVDDPAGLPLVLTVLSTFFLICTPVLNSFIRSQEMEADQFALNSAYQPDAEAQVDLALGEYRKLDPGPLEEIIFYDHPSGRVRIETAMRWKAEHLQNLRCLQAPAQPPSPPAPSPAVDATVH